MGARGLAPIGALAAMEEVGLDETDVVMGVSIGSLVASLLAFGLSSGEILSQLERVIIRSSPYNLTLPRDALFTLANPRREMELFFGPTRLQDCWLRLHCFSTNLSRNRLQAWCLGSIPTAVITSMSMPGSFPPVEDSRGDLHVDGGILNNLPIAAARGLSDGRVIAVSLDVDPDTADQDSPDRKRRRSSIARTIISAMMCTSHSQSRAQENLADLVLKPEIGAYPLLGWKSYREIVLADQGHARSRLGDGTRFRRAATPRS
ncbi:hypothetical protein BBFGKLBO_00856 [Synechococcus sp. CBW1107]|nr:hypothetical protein BBFGKLBO_00856 [Synechococcus sp. CBW1107]